MDNIASIISNYLVVGYFIEKYNELPGCDFYVDPV